MVSKEKPRRAPVGIRAPCRPSRRRRKIPCSPLDEDGGVEGSHGFVPGGGLAPGEDGDEGRDGDAGVAQQPLGHILVHADGRAEDPGPDEGDVREPQASLHGAVLAKGPCRTGKMTSSSGNSASSGQPSPERSRPAEPSGAGGATGTMRGRRPGVTASLTGASGRRMRRGSEACRRKRASSARCQRPRRSTPMSTMSQRSRSMASMTFFAERSDTSCSGDSPPRGRRRAGERQPPDAGTG